MQTYLGIDFGAKLAGTTVVCLVKDSELQLQQSTKKQDADAWLRKIIAEQRPNAVYLDAPLSLPGVYVGAGENYHYRQCDQLLGAMSPMFLGGLTARAMQLRAAFPAIPFYESYPAQLVRTLFPATVFYKKDLPAFLEQLAVKLPLPFAKPPENWHQVDAALAWWTGWRFEQKEAVCFGEVEEGLIWV
ncbi:MAG: DUF429 domain-containing protein [Bacteroidetes bacterium]|nr:DUF429 domain-containing protein [Bacteroidota bacterium]